MVYTKYYNLYLPSYKISSHFLLREFKCPGTYKVKYSSNILALLEKIRAHFGGRIEITSGYRSLAYNTSIGSSSTSAHIDGKAADFQTFDNQGNLVAPRLVCLFIEQLGWDYGIGMMRTATHIDEKFLGSRLDETRRDPSGYMYYLINKHEGTFSRYFGVPQKYPGILPLAFVSMSSGSPQDIENWQKFLCWWGLDIAVDRSFGQETYDATVAFQKALGLEQDGKVGYKTRKAAANVTK